jgi:uncharacterized membrane protein YkvA (DUF1232 family)
MADIDVGLTGQLNVYFSEEVEKIRSHELLIKSLEAGLNDWELQTKRAFSANELLDAKLGHALFLVCKEMLSLAREDGSSRSHLPFMLAAVSYVINQHDDSPDFESIIGFEDDAEVVARVIYKLNLAEKIKLCNPNVKEFFEHIAVKAIGGP